MTLGDFTHQAQAYGKSRPGYPDELIDQLITDAGLVLPNSPDSGEIATGSADCHRPAIADFGAGTGILTRILVQRGFVVSAIEPNESMRQQADLPEAKWIDGSFEVSGLATESQDWAVAAQAFHWADPPRSLPEIRRVLKPGRLFTVLWNNRTPVAGDTVDWTHKTIQRSVPNFEETYRLMETPKLLESTGDFLFTGQREAVHTVTMSRERYLNLWHSHNHLNTVAGPERFQQFYEELVDYLHQQRIEQIEVRYTCRAWSARRVD